jgi:hypothetical protein
MVHWQLLVSPMTNWWLGLGCPNQSFQKPILWVQTLINELQSSNCKTQKKRGTKAKQGWHWTHPVHMFWGHDLWMACFVWDLVVKTLPLPLCMDNQPTNQQTKNGLYLQTSASSASFKSMILQRWGGGKKILNKIGRVFFAMECHNCWEQVIEIATKCRCNSLVLVH